MKIRVFKGNAYPWKKPKPKNTLWYWEPVHHDEDTLYLPRGYKTKTEAIAAAESYLYNLGIAYDGLKNQ